MGHCQSNHGVTWNEWAIPPEEVEVIHAILYCFSYQLILGK